MSPVDALLLCTILAVAIWRLAAPERGRRVRGVVAIAALALCGVQAVLLGFTWQFVSGWLLLGASAWPWRLNRRTARVAGRVGLAALILAALAPWAMWPAPVLPRPGGPYAVGAQVFRWVDASRPETATADPADRRNVIVQAWYPAAGAPGAAAKGREPYLDGAGRLPQPVMGVPRFVFRRFGQADTHAARNADVSEARRAWPVVIFGPGYGAPRAVYAGLAADLASRGYVVLAVDHPYEAAVTQLADGRVVGPGLDDRGHDGQRIGFMERQVLVRVADLRFVLDQLGRPGALGPRLSGRLDTTRVAAIGHSFGGAAATLLASGDPRIMAAADIDGMLYGPVRGETLRGPLLVLQSGRTEEMAPYMAVTEAVLSRTPAGGWRYAIGGANHFSFTDAEFAFSPPARWVVARALSGPRGAAGTQRATVDLLDAFLSGPLKDRPGDVAAVAARYPGVKGGPRR